MNIVNIFVFFISSFLILYVAHLVYIKFFVTQKKFDDFLSGRFHFQKKTKGSILDQVKYALAKNDQDALFYQLNKIEGANDVVKEKTKRISNDTITIGFFCSYMNSGIVRNTVGVYNKYFKKIKWVGCGIGQDHLISGFSCPMMNFPDIKTATKYADTHFDFVVDADSFLRPDNFYEIIKNTSSYTMNFFNLACSTYNNYFDVAFVPETVELSKYPPSEKYLVRVPSLNSWVVEKPTNFFTKYYYDIAFIGDQLKYGKTFFKSYNIFSLHFKIVFIGLRDIDYFKKKLIKNGWNLDNIEFHPRLDKEEDFRIFLTKSKVVIDTPDYSGGSSNVYALGVGTPVLTLKGKYLVDGMISAVLHEMDLAELCFDKVEDMVKFIRSKSINEFIEYREYIINKVYNSCQFNPDKHLPIFYERLMDAFKDKQVPKLVSER